MSYKYKSKTDTVEHILGDVIVPNNETGVYSDQINLEEFINNQNTKSETNNSTANSVADNETIKTIEVESIPETQQIIGELIIGESTKEVIADQTIKVVENIVNIENVKLNEETKTEQDTTDLNNKKIEMEEVEKSSTLVPSMLTSELINSKVSPVITITKPENLDKFNKPKERKNDIHFGNLLFLILVPAIILMAGLLLILPLIVKSELTLPQFYGLQKVTSSVNLVNMPTNNYDFEFVKKIDILDPSIIVKEGIRDRKKLDVVSIYYFFEKGDTPETTYTLEKLEQNLLKDEYDFLKLKSDNFNPIDNSYYKLMFSDYKDARTNVIKQGENINNCHLGADNCNLDLLNEDYNTMKLQLQALQINLNQYLEYTKIFCRLESGEQKASQEIPTCNGQTQQIVDKYLIDINGLNTMFDNNSSIQYSNPTIDNYSSINAKAEFLYNGLYVLSANGNSLIVSLFK